MHSNGEQCTYDDMRANNKILYVSQVRAEMEEDNRYQPTIYHRDTGCCLLECVGHNGFEYVVQ